MANNVRQISFYLITSNFKFDDQLYNRILMLKQPIEQSQPLSGPKRVKPKAQPQKFIHANFKLIMALLLIIFALAFYQLGSKIFSLSRKQKEVSQIIQDLQYTTATAQQKVELIKKLANSSFSDFDKQILEMITGAVKDLEKKFFPSSSVQPNEIPLDLLERVIEKENQIDQREAIIQTLISHSKDQFRRKKIEMFEQISKKDDFQDQRARNPWAMSRLNLRTRYIDTLQKRHMEEEVKKQMDRLQQKYRLSTFSKQLPLCVIVPSRNNAQNYRYEYNIQSIINQDYSNYRTIFIDDASSDRTADLIQLFITRNKLSSSKFRLIRNKQRRSAIPNVYDAVLNYCGPEDIVLIVSGDDELLGKQVFKVINAVYQTKNPAVAYTNHFFGKLNDNDFQLGYSRAYTFGQTKNRLFRFIGQKFGHMRTFLASLFREIRVEDLQDREGNWINTTYDEAFFIPMLQMACDSVEYIDQYMYLYNYGTGNSDGQVRHQAQSDNAIYVRSQPRYACLPKYQKYIL